MAKANQFVKTLNPDGTKRDGLEHNEQHYRLLNRRLKVSRADKTRNKSNVSRLEKRKIGPIVPFPLEH